MDLWEPWGVYEQGSDNALLKLSLQASLPPLHGCQGLAEPLSLRNLTYPHHALWDVPLASPFYR